MKPRFLNIVLDTLSGCGWYCRGCYVRNANQSFNEFEKIKKVIAECEADGLRVSCIRVGPTDVFSADNATSFLLDPRFIDLAKSPQTDLAFNTSLLENEGRITEIIEILNRHYKKDYIHFNVVLNHKQIDHPAYLGKISENIELIRKLSRNTVKFAPGINVEPSEEFLKEDLSRVHRYAAQAMPDLELELAINFTRRTETDPALVNRAFDVVNQIGLVTRMFNANNIECENSFLNILWHEGKWHWAPNLYYEFANATDPRMEIRFNSYLELLESFNQLFVSQYYQEGIECVNCEFQKLCSLRFIPAYMKILNRARCVAPKTKMIECLRYAEAAPPNY
ncbi:MAG: hypothetical protein P4M08_10305 [Oligoflexia bacterium]|nr:hypothetical protein [Oligoflexia bacterium]